MPSGTPYEIALLILIIKKATDVQVRRSNDNVSI